MILQRLLLHAGLVVGLISPGLPVNAAEEFRPVSQTELDKFYSEADRRVGVTVKTAEVLNRVNPAFLGVNMSYFLTTDEMWKKYGFNDKLRAGRIGALRYPGGHETGFLHWEHPGVNGYEDLWAPEEQHGTAPYRGRFQTTWVSPDKWATNESFMNFDEFMKVCTETGAEPIVGINLSSGRKYNRQKDGIDEALRWLRYCKEKNYAVKYWFLECEPWHRENNYTFTEKEYSEDVLAYGRAIKKEFPDVKLIINPTGPDGYRHTEWLSGLIRETKEVVDYIDYHWYWEWNTGSFDMWRKQTPVGLSNAGVSYAEAVELVRKACAQAGAPNIGVVILEWNLAPSQQNQTFSESLSALVQAEILMQYLESRVELTCLWPLIWASSRDVWPEQDFFPGVVTLDPPYNPTRSMDLFRMLAPVQGSDRVLSSTDSPDAPVIAVVHEDKLHVYCLNKSSRRRRITVTLDRAATTVANPEYFALKNQVMMTLDTEQTGPDSIRFFAEPYSFNAIELSLTKEGTTTK